MKKLLYILTFFICTFGLSQTFTYSGYIYNANNVGASNVPVRLYKRTTPTLNGFTSQTNYNNHSYYRSTGTATWTAAKTACEGMNGHLVTFSSVAENTFVYNTWPSGWIGYYQDRVAGFSYSEPSGGYRWTEQQVTTNLQADYDVASYTSGTVLTDIKSSINTTLSNSPIYTSTSGKYLTFNGTNQYGITGNLASKVTGNVVTLLAWIYPIGNGVVITELGTGSTSSGWHDAQIEITGGNTLRCGIWNNTIAQVNTTITLNAWHLVGFTYDGTTLTGYKDGASFGTLTTARQNPVSNGNGLYYGIGLADATNMGSGAYGAFRLGDFQVFDRAITADEVNRTYNLYAYRYGIYPVSNWNSGEPNDSGGEDYTQFVSGGKWNDLNNTSSLNYVLEFDYIVGYTPWVLYQTVYTNSSGYYSFSQSTNPATEWYIQIDVPITITPIQEVDAQTICTKAILKTITSLDYYKYDVNNDGKITVSDSYYVFMKKNGRFTTWGNLLPNNRLFTAAQFSTINSSTTDLRIAYPGVSSITINTPTSGGSSNYYIINTGYSNISNLQY
jgi:hypothetical protein